MPCEGGYCQDYTEAILPCLPVTVERLHPFQPN